MSRKKARKAAKKIRQEYQRLRRRELLEEVVNLRLELEHAKGEA